MTAQAAQIPRSAVIVGMGRTGLSVARHLQRCGYGIAMTDTRESPPELAGVQALGSSVVARTSGLRPLKHAELGAPGPRIVPGLVVRRGDR